MRTSSFALLGLLSLSIACGSSGESSSGSGGSGSTGGSGGSETSGSSGGATGGSSGGTAGEAEARENVVVGTDPCTTDADCVPSGCCHPASCVAAANAPTCADVMCTMDCQYGTLDCGGSCFCQAGHCAARLSGRPVDPSMLPES